MEQVVFSIGLWYVLEKRLNIEHWPLPAILCLKTNYAGKTRGFKYEVVTVGKALCVLFLDQTFPKHPPRPFSSGHRENKLSGFTQPLILYSKGFRIVRILWQFYRLSINSFLFILFIHYSLYYFNLNFTTNLFLHLLPFYWNNFFSIVFHRASM